MTSLHCRHCKGAVTLADPATLPAREPLKAVVVCDTCRRRLGSLEQALAFVARKEAE